MVFDEVIQSMGTLFVVATPLGNLDDISPRALNTFRVVTRIYCEDTRVTAKLLAAYDIHTSLSSYHQHSGAGVGQKILAELQAGESLALVTDAGTPGISDPGNLLIQYLTEQDPNISVSPIPGPSAVITALSISGFPTDKFLFLGFPPHKKKRQTFFADVAKATETVVFYESNHRIEKCLAELANVLDPERQLCICRELTKKFESIYRGKAKDVLISQIPTKGEFVIIVSRPFHSSVSKSV